MNYEDKTDLEINAMATCEMFDCNGWEYSENGGDCAFYRCGVDGSGYYKQPVVDFCGDFNCWYPIAEKYGMSIDINGHASIPKSASELDSIIRHLSPKKIGRAVVICFLKMKGEEK